MYYGESTCMLTALLYYPVNTADSHRWGRFEACSAPRSAVKRLYSHVFSVQHTIQSILKTSMVTPGGVIHGITVGF